MFDFNLLKKLLFFSLLSILLLSCGNERRITPCDIERDEINKALAPNDEGSPENLTFGKNNIPGFIFDYDITTDNNDVFVYFQNLTVLDINPKINQSVADFITQQMTEYGFINDSVSLPENEFVDLNAAGLSYTQATVRYLDQLKEAFNAQLKTISTLDTPFNMYFQVYPVFLDDNFVTYRQLAYAYTGGAHGMTVTYFKTYDLKTGEELSFDEIIRPEDKTMVREEIAAHMAYSYPIYENITTVSQYIDSLNVWLDNFTSPDERGSITVDNFPVSDIALLKEGLVVVYQMYELTPGSDGCPIIFIPYKNIKGALKIEVGQ